ncbi:MAG: serine/threonine-protein kinase, partial [Planctomycetota bacterium]
MPGIKEVEAWFHEALEFSDSTQRSRFLEARCGADRKLFKQLMKMVEADSRQHALLDEPTKLHHDAAMATPATPALSTELPPGTQLGPFEIVRTIGKGGMGTVHEAIQEQPIERRVAVKVIRPTPGNSALTNERFMREREALSRLQHPNITTILDAGIDEDGRLFFAMELIDGESITGYCDARQLTITERIRIFEKVCLAIHHAHQRGILHLDIKPGNLMIQTVDDAPVP